MLSAPTPEAAIAIQDRGNSDNPADRYGFALAQMRMSLSDNAEQILRDLDDGKSDRSSPIESARPKR